jgi:hypothetical protein
MARISGNYVYSNFTASRDGGWYNGSGSRATPLSGLDLFGAQGEWNRVVTVTSTNSPFTATGSNFAPSAFVISGSGAMVLQLQNGGIVSGSAFTSGIVHEIGVQQVTVTSGAINLLYR